MFKVIYDLSKESEEIARLQAVSLSESGAGLKAEPALIGSTEWWDLVDTVRLPLIKVTGIVSDVHFSGHGDFPEFEVTSGSEKTYWEIYGDIEKYKIGSKITIEYVLMELKEDPWLGVTNGPIECVLKVILND